MDLRWFWQCWRGGGGPMAPRDSWQIYVNGGEAGLDMEVSLIEIYVAQWRLVVNREGCVWQWWTRRQHVSRVGLWLHTEEKVVHSVEVGLRTYLRRAMEECLTQIYIISELLREWCDDVARWLMVVSC
ncbi:hypothetical protein VNO78_18096 [Psophocarpus tetragonolobus]|uniref:Uncharacterized protein n=1 Tax=Psophocarpus tetragonolobus TaxID=3891 RepID=A0AAN9SHR2_PSOTE